MRLRDLSGSTTPTKPAPPRPTGSQQNIMADFAAFQNAGLLQGVEIEEAFAPTTDTASASPTRNPTSSIPDAKLTSDEAGWIRQEFPSLGVPYGREGQPFWVKPFDVTILANVHAAQATGERPGNELKAFTMLVDALSPCIKNFDIRDLTVPDYFSFMYWLRLNSYPRSPFTVPWTSKYGNEVVSKLNYSDFEFEELSMTSDEYRKWRKEGLTFPTVRDMEILTDSTLEVKDRWYINYAQYIYVDGPPDANWMRRKIDRFIEMGTDAVSLVKEFAAKASHGVIEQIRVSDSSFDIDKAIAFFKEQIDTLTDILNAALGEAAEEDTNGVQALIAIGSKLTELKEDYDKLVKIKANNGIYQGKIYTPEKEVVPLAPASATLLFP